EGKAPSICEKFPHAEFPARLDQIIKQALELKPAKRQASVSEFCEQLTEVLNCLERSSVPKSSKLVSFVRSFLEKKNES
ncbi:MAG: hypothetical protein K2X27_26980, partial [Candidatus Obscuribacterales bacterium]|nr:hypothetical protein [Candidatus Obscuribacterales bacterium]